VKILSAPTKVIATIPILFFVIVVAQVTLNYFDNERAIKTFIYKQASTLNTFMLAHRNYYIHLYENKMIPLDEKSLAGLPAFSAYEISNTFSKANELNIKLQTVSDIARNPKNNASFEERKAIAFFKQNPSEKEYFVKENDVYQYATPLFITQRCLSCHGEKASAPEFIQKRYENAYNYKLGELRGIVSIRVPLESIEQNFRAQIVKNIFYNFLLMLGLLALVGYLLKYLRHKNITLEEEVDRKTQSLRQNLALLESYKLALDHSVSVSRTDKKGVITYVNDIFCQNSGYTKEELIGKSHNILRSPRMKKELFKEMWETISSGKTWRGILENRRKDGSFYWVDAAITPIVDENNTIVEYIAIRHEITQIIQQKKDLEMIATTTLLSGYKNRFQLLKDISAFKNLSLALIDIDHFSEINDFYGHDLGDELIVNVAHFIHETMVTHSHYSFYHLGGDVFALLGHDVSQDDFTQKHWMLIQKIVAQSFTCKDEVFYVNIAIGISYEQPEFLLKTADMALKSVKKEHKELLVYTQASGLEKLYEDNLRWTAKVRDALLSNAIVPFFQPIYDNTQNAITKYEALVRLMDNDIAISPFFFLDVAKKSKQYDAITHVMILKTFEAMCKNEYEVSLNLTIEDILNTKIQAYLFEMLERYKNGYRVIFEIVESESILNFAEVMEFVKRIKKYGCRIAIDDFGTGYSNFEYLLKLQVDFIKIDGSLIKGLISEDGSEHVVEIIIDFARRIGTKTIAEFVENEALYAKVKAMGIDFSQGYFHGKPNSTL